jgi:hypothetical protein
VYAQVFRDTFFPFWDSLVNNIFGVSAGCRAMPSKPPNKP